MRNLMLKTKMRLLDKQVKRARVKRVMKTKMMKMMRMNSIWKLMEFKSKLKMSEDTSKRMMKIKIFKEGQLLEQTVELLKMMKRLWLITVMC